MKEDIRELENQRRKIDYKIQQYYEDEQRNHIKINEELLVGKCYKYSQYGETTYFKILSGLTNDTYDHMYRMMFRLPANPMFRLNMSIHGINKFNYFFQSDIITFDDFSILNELKQNEKVIEITVKEFEQALEELGKQLILVSRDDFTMNGKYFIK